ncbi:GNAT family N-acetyltransferase [Telluria beijingensis]|uniref:GNAT family N-acetyltransferase n=1 Tax=Telluria beijingensis TaxID=3068633 RepID=UPI002795D1CF|nr:GNAT family N-acetyltransferase [Massilia sp. REN29]
MRVNIINLEQPASDSPGAGIRIGYLEGTPHARDGHDAFVRAHPDASPYHLDAWRAAVADAYGHAGKVLVATDGARIVGSLPLCIVARPLHRPLWSALPFCDLGGPLALTDEIGEALVARAVADAVGAGAAGFEARASAPAPLDAEALVGRKVRMVLELPASAEALMAGYPPKLRSQIRKAEKNGLRAAPGTGPEVVRAFHEVYSRNMLRLGSPPHGLRWFAAIQRHYGDDMFIMLVRLGERVVGAGLVLRCGGRAAIPWASTLADVNHLAPNMLLYWAIQARLCELGVRRFDFGRSTFGEGTYQFKKQWGAQPQALDWRAWDASGRLEAPPAVGDAGKGGARALAEHMWKQFPLALSNALGPRLRRYITL